MQAIHDLDIARQESPPSGLATHTPASAVARARRAAMRLLLRSALLCYNILVRLGRPSPPANRPQRILLTATFYSDNWILAHLRPLAASAACERIYMVATAPVPAIPKVTAIYPPPRLRRLLGDVPARLLTFFWSAMRLRPDIVGGFHLLLNGLLAQASARLVGARSLYLCVGGPLEVLEGGIHAENRLFSRLETPDPVIERQLLRAIGSFDLVVTMGTRAVRFLRARGLRTRFEVIPGGIDDTLYRPSIEPPTTDLILVGRLAPIKRIDIFLRAVAIAARQLPSIRATIVGDGEQRSLLERIARDAGIERNVCFVGLQQDVARWLRQARVFALTSDSEGLALSLMEAMMSGLPGIVSDVGDLADLVEDGVNGHLVPRRNPEAFAARFVDLLGDPQRCAAAARAARASALRHSVEQTARLWDRVLGCPRGGAVNAGRPWSAA